MVQPAGMTIPVTTITPPGVVAAHQVLAHAENGRRSQPALSQGVAYALAVGDGA